MRFLKLFVAMIIVVLTATACSQTSPEGMNSDSPSPYAGNVGQYAKQTLVLSGETTWRYLDEDAQQFISQTGLDWTMPEYDESAWKTGAGSFGAKDGALATLASGYTPNILLNQYLTDSTKNVPAYFFRTEFSVSDPSQIESMQGAVCYDDAVIVYLNGAVVFSGNTPEGGYADSFSYGAAAALGSPVTAEFQIDGTLLREGKNVLAVELRQADAHSSDVFFDLVKLETAQARITQVSLGVGRDLEQALLCWSREGALQENSYVRVWSNNDLSAQVRTFPVSSTEPCFVGYTYRAEISGLAEGQDYLYQIVCGKGITSGKIAAASAEDGIDVLLIGDPQLHNGEEASEAASLNAFLGSAWHEVDYMMCLGDIATDASNPVAYQEAFRAMNNGVRMGAVMGNHDEESENYSDSLYLPNMTQFGAVEGCGVMSGDYWFAMDGVLFMGLNSNSDDVSAHAQFLDQALEDYTERYGAPEWRLVFMHHALFSQGANSDHAYTLALRERLAPIFSRMDIDVVFAGHDHSYSRSYLMRGMDTVSYAGDHATKRQGETLYLTLNSSTGSKFYDLADETQDFIAFSSQSYHAMLTRLCVVGGNLRMWTYEPESGELVDDFILLHEADQEG